MNDEDFRELEAIRQELEIPKIFLICIIALTLKYQIINNISDEECFEIIKEAMANYDYEYDMNEYKDCSEETIIKEAYMKRKTIEQSFYQALKSLCYIDNYRFVKKR